MYGAISGRYTCKTTVIQTIMTIRVVMLLLFFCASPAFAGDNGDMAGRARRLYNEGREALHRNDYNTGLSKLLDYIKIEERLEKKDTADLITAFYNVGGVYSVYSDFAQALDIYRRGYRLSVENGDTEMQFTILNNMVGSACYVKEVDEAEYYNEKVGKLKVADKGKQAYYYYFNKGFIAGCRGNNAAKIRYMQMAISMVDKYRMPGDMKVYAYSELYLSYEQSGNLEQALACLHRVLRPVDIHQDTGMGLRQPPADFLGNLDGGHGEGLIRTLGLHFEGLGAVQVLSQIVFHSVKNGVQVLFTGAAPAQAHHTENRMAALPGPIHVRLPVHRLNIDGRLHNIHVKIAVQLHPTPDILPQPGLKLALIRPFQDNFSQFH